MILVDDLREYTGSPLARERRWCHMVSDSNETELHQFAERLGLRREWYQEGRRFTGQLPLSHYDLTARRRAKAIALGAVAVGAKELVRRHWNRAVLGACSKCGATGVKLYRARLIDGSGLECEGCRS